MLQFAASSRRLASHDLSCMSSERQTSAEGDSSTAALTQITGHKVGPLVCLSFTLSFSLLSESPMSVFSACRIPDAYFLYS